MTHPPEPINNGFMITWPLSSTIHYTEPKTLVRELKENNLHYHSDIVTMYRGQEDYLKLTKQYITEKTKSVHYLAQQYQPEVLFVVYTEVDRVSHHYWGENAWPNDEVIQVYQQIDDAVGELIRSVSDDTLIVLASDHGFGHCSRNLNVHYLLQQHGLLVYDEQITPDAKQAEWFGPINWPCTKIYMPTPGCFGLNLNLKERQAQGCVSLDQHNELLTELQTIFSQLTDEQGKAYFEVQPREQVYQGNQLLAAPDFLLMPNRWDIMPQPSTENKLWTKPTQEAIHRMQGIYGVLGQTFPQKNSTSARIEDIAPTILAHLKVPIQQGLTGSPLFMEDSALQYETRKNVFQTNSVNEAETDLLVQRLTDLGYL